ncbi:unnamed protein product [Meganyctiphanes norvegica]|uniref:Alpha-methylacyl-CoA racemase n=1 Tax=Meganyctiphanes norvegica TaxID=48144 RepID=A0AAV2RED8_MEGNR
MPLHGIRVLEFAGLAPAPFCGMVLSDFGASVIRVDKLRGPDVDRSVRGKRSVAVNLKNSEGVSVIKKLASKADIIIEPYRRGVMEKMGLGPKELMAENPKLIYARLTGFGQSGPYADMAGHDINYVALSGLLSILGRKDGPPTPPINLLADFAGGGLMCALGIVLALLERSKSGIGQVIDANMVEGAAYVGSWMYSSRDLRIWDQGRGKNWLDSGAHFYDTYETSDGRYMACGAVEPQFYHQMMTLLGLDPDAIGQFDDYDNKKNIIATTFKQKTQEDWCKIFDGKDACVTPVLSLDEAPHHPHNAARNSFVASSKGNVMYEPRPAPLLSRTPAQVTDTSHSLKFGQHTHEILAENGFTQQEIEKLITSKIVAQATEASKL